MTELAYLAASVLFIVGLRGLTHPRTAVRGNLLGALGMLVAVIATLWGANLSFGWIVTGLAIGAAGGVYFAKTVPMTSMPQMVALLNGFGGGASVLVAGAYLYVSDSTAMSWHTLAATAASGLIGGVTLSGSIIAYAKLEEIDLVKEVRIPAHQVWNVSLFAACLLVGVLLVVQPGAASVWFWLLAIISLALGVLLVIFIGGADMPVVIALLNSYSGLAGAATGFVLSNDVLIIAGSLVGASGIILVRIMCVAMNRSLPAVLFGTLQPAAGAASADEVYVNVKSTTADEVAMLLDAARRVVIIPGYGLAVAQAQHAVRDLTNLLAARNVAVEFGIHPVAGRMPGHMNVLLAEADIPYDSMKEMDDINPTMDQVDVAIVLGANDVVNPVARTDPKSPLAGMPIINADKARTVVVIKRSLSPGFAGIPNPLFAADNALMLYADGNKAVLDIIKALQDS